MPSLGSNKTSFWRQAGLSYLQYLAIASRAVRASLKVRRYLCTLTPVLMEAQEPLKTKAIERSMVHYNRAGPTGEKQPIKSFLP